MKKAFFSILFTIISLNIYGIDGLIIKTIDHSFQEKWYNTISSSVPKIINYDTIFKRQDFFITPVVWGFECDNLNLCNVDYSIKIIKPDSSIYLQKENLPVINREIQNKKNLQMGDAVLKISFNLEDLFGEYNIEIQIHDRISLKTKIINSKIFLQKLPHYSNNIVSSEQEFQEWVNRYYKYPRPEKALSHYIYYSKSKLAENESSFLPIFSIFLEITKNNKFLLPQILECYKEQDDQTKSYLIFLLHYSNLASNNFFINLQGIEKDIYDSIKDQSLPDIYGEITDPSQLDMLWATFNSSGSYKPILKLIETLDFVKYEGDLEKYKTSKQTEEDRQKAINNAIYDALVWSFISNCKQHELIINYSNWALQNENLNQVQKNELQKILEQL